MGDTYAMMGKMTKNVINPKKHITDSQKKILSNLT